MINVRCRCGKIVCQVENLPEVPRRLDAHQEDGYDQPQSPAVVILCRHCKSYVVLHVPEVTSIFSREGTTPSKPKPPTLSPSV